MSVWLSVGLSNIFQVPKDFAVYGRQFREKFGTLVLHINAEKPVQLDFRNFHYLFFPDFMFKNLELTCHLTSFHDEFIVTPSGWKPLDAASVCRESTQILQNCETSSRSAQAPLTLKVNPLLISTCSLNTNIRCHIFRPIRCEKHVVWQPALSFCAIPFNGIPPLVRCIPRSANQFIA